MIKLDHIPLEDNYGASLDSGVYSLRVAGGPSRSRQAVSGSPRQVDITWVLTADEYEDLLFTYENELARGAVPFITKLVLDSSDLKEYTVQMIADSFVLGAIEGEDYLVNVSLLVQRPTLDATIRAYVALAGGVAVFLPDAMQEAMEKIERN